MLQDYNLITLWYDDIVIWRCTKVVQKTKVVWNPLIKLWIEFWIELWRTLLHSLEQRESSTLPLAHFLFHTSSSTFPLPHFLFHISLLHLPFYICSSAAPSSSSSLLIFSSSSCVYSSSARLVRKSFFRPFKHEIQYSFKTCRSLKAIEQIYF